MRDPARIDRILKEFGKAWKANPDQRFGQLYANLTGHHRDPFHVEDDEVEAGLKRLAVDGKWSI